MGAWRQDRRPKAGCAVDTDGALALEDDEGPAVIILWRAGVGCVDAHSVIVRGDPSGGGHRVVVGAALVEDAHLVTRSVRLIAQDRPVTSGTVHTAGKWAICCEARGKKSSRVPPCGDSPVGEIIELFAVEVIALAVRDTIAEEIEVKATTRAGEQQSFALLDP